VTIEGIDLTRFRPVRALVLWRGFPYVFQVVILALYVTFALVGWGRFPPVGVEDKLYAKSNVINLVTWALWWPAMIWVAVLFGRAWCIVCPLELVANGSERLGRRLGIRQRALGPRLRAGVLIVALYALILMLVDGVHLHRIPAYTSVYLWTLLAAAVITGLLYKDRAFCRGFCPVGLLLGTYGRGSMLAVRRASKETCEACTEKSGVAPENRTKLDGRSCPSLLNPAKLNACDECLLCTQCIKACPYDNVRLILRRPFPAADKREPMASWPVTLFVILVSGFLTYELSSEWKLGKAVFLWVPDYVTQALAAVEYAGWIKGLWTLFVFPPLVWLILGGLTCGFRGASSLAEAWRKLALPIAVVVSSAHMVNAIRKAASWGGYLPLVLRDPLGTSTAQAITAGTMGQPAHVLAVGVVSTVGVVLMITGALFALREARLADPERYRGRVPAIVALALFFTVIVLQW